MKNSTNIFSLLLLGFICGGLGCRKFVDIGNPKNQITSTAVFADSTDANAAVLGIYVSMMQVGSFGINSGGMTLVPGLSSDELSLSATDINYSPFYNYQILTNNGVNQNLWLYSYKFIYECNACIEGITGASSISPNAKNILIGEVRFLRAFTYFNLVNLYGPVPLILSTDFNSNRLVGRSSMDDIYGQIISDLKYAQTSLPVNTLNKSRAGYYSATALLSKAYLYTGIYSQALTEADKIVNANQYSLVSNLNNVFLATSTETIWNMQPVVPNRNSWEAYYFVPSSATVKPKYLISAPLYASFEAGDQRKVNWIKVNTVAGQNYPYPYKYKVASSTVPTEYPVVFRLAEIYLIRAEAKANLNDISGSATDLNLVRKRAGLSGTLAADKASLLLAIEKERQAELFCEWGNRWFDLKRTNRASTILSSEKMNWNDNALLYPVPITEINTNPNLNQNPGY
ncbi:MAG: hypothetical protein JWQ79_426 [Mucilaginibacter sp.]|nr:hypothetical protein [Mucilaginibacter sp.]